MGWRHLPLGLAVLMLPLAPASAPHRSVPDPSPGDPLLACEPSPEPGPCVHGSEPPPPGADAWRRPTTDELKRRRAGSDAQAEATLAEVGEPAAAAATWPIACIGDGVSGPRVQAIYARASDVSDRFRDVAPLIARYAADVDYRIDRAASASGQGRRVRYVTTSGGSCQLTVANVTLSRSGDDNLANLMAELRDKGFARTDRKYLVWVDAAVGICGLGQMYRDDRPTSDNPNNRAPMYARVDAPCWGYAEAHELLHTLGAVQYSAPNASSAGHCVDENDALCYVDSDTTKLVYPCSQAASWTIDCGLNDYFNAAPPQGSYLARHWNTATSSWLERVAPPPAPPTVSVTAPSSMLAGSAVAVSAKVSVPAGRTHQITWTTSRSDCRFDNPGAAATGYWCPVTAASSTLVTARVRDSEGLMASASKTIQLPVPSRPRATALSVRAPTAVTHGQRATVAGQLTDAQTGRAVIGMPVRLWTLPAGSKTWTSVATATTGRKGGVKLTHAPARKSAYKLTAGATTTWATARSKSVTVGVRPNVTATASTTTAPQGTQRATVTGTVAPPHPGQAVVLQRQSSSGWTTVRKVPLSAKSGYRFDLDVLTAVGSQTYRVVKPADSDHLPAASAPVTIRTL